MATLIEPVFIPEVLFYVMQCECHFLTYFFEADWFTPGSDVPAWLGLKAMALAWPWPEPWPEYREHM